MFNPATLCDDFPHPVLTLSTDMPVIIWANQAAQAWLGKSLRLLEGQHLTAIFSENTPLIEAHKRCMDVLSPVNLRDCPLRRAGQVEERCHLVMFPSENAIGLSVQFAGGGPQQDSIYGDNLSAMGRMLAHEIKNPLAGIDGAAQLLGEDLETEDGQALITLIRSEIDRVRRLAERMERLGDESPAKGQAVNIHEILRDTRKIIQSAASDNILFSENYDPSLPAVNGDADMLTQAVLNLIKNATEALPDGGHIQLETAFRSGVSRRISGQEEPRQLPVEIRVIDNGAGVPDAIRDDIFQPFVTAKPSGQGLGLSLVSKVATAHGGIVEMRSRPGQTVFSLLLPIAEIVSIAESEVTS